MTQLRKVSSVFSPFAHSLLFAPPLTGRPFRPVSTQRQIAVGKQQARNRTLRAGHEVSIADWEPRKSVSTPRKGGQVASHESTVSRLITGLSEAYRHTHAVFAADGVLDATERRVLRLHGETLHGLQQLDDDMAEGFAKARYGRVLPYHEKRRRMTANSNIVQLFADDEPQTAA